MTRACTRCRPAVKLGLMNSVSVDLPDGSTVEEVTTLCDSHRQQAAKENKAGRLRLAKPTDLPLLEFLFTAPSAKEPVR